jgi:hypothetical protein
MEHALAPLETEERISPADAAELRAYLDMAAHQLVNTP